MQPTIAMLQSIVDQTAAPYRDERLHLFNVKVEAQPDGSAVLRGKVHTASQRQALADALKKAFPQDEISLKDVAVMRLAAPRLMTVAANLSSMHAGPSFLAEQVTQLLNGMRLEILWEEGNWAYVQKTGDPADTYMGWTYLPYLDMAAPPAATHLVTHPVTPLRAAADSTSRPVTRLLGGTQVAVIDNRGDLALVAMAGGTTGWLPYAYLRSLDSLSQTEIVRRAQIMQDAFTLIGVPYLWGGCSANGIDCSGLAQLLHRWLGIALPRDADMQFEAGKPVEPPFQRGDLLFFGERGEKRKITHVAISMGGWQIIHSSRSRNGVQMDDVQTVPGLHDSFLCAATYLG